MSSPLLVVQFYTLREFTQTGSDLARAFAKCRKIGYTAVQLSAVQCMQGERPEVDAMEARRMLDGEGLRCVATHRGVNQLIQNLDFEIDFHHTLGASYTAPGAIIGEYGKAAEGYARFLADTLPARLKMKAAGIDFGYHNHDWEFIRDSAAGKRGIDVLIEDVGLPMEIDVYWVAQAGADPSAMLERLRGRIRAVHLKDKEVVEGDGGVMAPVGEGNLNWDAILRAGVEGGMEYAIVEQDVCRRDPFDCLRSSFDFLAPRLAG